MIFHIYSYACSIYKDIRKSIIIAIIEIIIDVVLETSWRETKEGQKSRIAGIIFCVRQMLGVPSISGEVVNFIRPHFFINPYSKFNYSKELEEMARIFGIYPDWM